MSAEPLLLVEGMNTYYDASHILHDVDLAVGEGEVMALLGRNGVGKTTTLQSILGLPPPRSGSVTFRGKQISGLPTHAIVREGIGWVPQGHRIFATLSVAENLMLAAQNARPGPWDLPRIFELFPWMRERRGARGAYLSGGEQQMLAIARALIQNPAIILMDEPSEGLSPKIVEEIGNVVRRLSAEGSTILMVEQNLGFALRTAGTVLVMSKGQIVHRGCAAEIAADPELCRQYLGVSGGHGGRRARREVQ